MSQNGLLLLLYTFFVRLMMLLFNIILDCFFGMIFKLHFNEPSMIVSQNNKSSMIVSQDNEPSMIVSQNNKSSMIVSQNNKPSMIVSQNNEPSMIVSQDNEPSMIVSQNNEPSMIVSQNNEPSMIVVLIAFMCFMLSTGMRSWQMYRERSWYLSSS